MVTLALIIMLILVVVLALAVAYLRDELAYEKRRRAQWQDRCRELLEIQSGEHQRHREDIQRVQRIRQTASEILAN